MDEPSAKPLSPEEPLLAFPVEPLPVTTRPRYDWRHPARMPERFGMGLMLIAMAVVSISFWLLRLIQTPPGVIFFFTIFFTLIAIAQMLFPHSPRKSSVVVGAIFCPIWSIAGFLIAYFGPRQAWGVEQWIAEMAFFSICSLPFGGLFGYLAGGLVAGIFLLLGWSSEEHEPQSPVIAELDSGAAAPTC